MALVLSGGGARGFAHIGVLKALEENQIDIDLIVGTSIGSIVGGFFCAGFSADQIQRIAKEIDWDNIISDATYRPHLFFSQKNIPRRHILQVRLDGIVPYIPQSLTQGQNVYQLIYRRLLQAEFQAINSFDDLKIPFRSVATDLISGQRVVLDSGDLAEAIHASFAFPLLFAPVEFDGMQLVDGGITDNLPVDVAKDLGSDIVVAVDATSPLRDSDEMNAPWEIADQVTTIMMEGITRESFKKADLAVKPNLEQHRAGDFTNIDSIVEVGYRAGIEFVDSLKILIDKKNREVLGENLYLGQVAEIHFAGDSSLHLSQMRDSVQMRTRLGEHLYDYDVLHDIESVYKSGLYIDVRAKALIDSSGKCYVTFYLKEQPQVRHLSILHGNILPDSTISSAFLYFFGKPLNISKLQNRLEKIRYKLIQQGYSLSEIDSVRFNTNNQRLEIQLDEGVIDEIQIEGNRQTKNFVILREFPIQEGEFFKSDLAVQGIQNIYSTGLFDRVTIDIEMKNDENILIINVKEKKYLLLRIGAHASLERKSEGIIEVLHDNFLGTGVKFSTMGAIGDFMRRANSSLYTTRLFNTYLTARLSFYYNEREDRYYEDFERKGNYLTIRRGSKFMIGQQIGRLGLISLQFRLESIHVNGDNLDFPYSDHYRLRSLVVRSEVDKRDRLPFPQRGIYNRWFWETGNQRVLGGNTSFTRIFLGLEGYYQFLKYFNYHPYLYAGSADITLPFSEFFTFGGQLNFPGLHQREKFGRQFTMTGIELRYQINWDLPIEAYVSSSYSIGGVWERPDEEIDASDFFNSLSLSFALNSIVGPIQMTYSRLIDERSLFYLSFGFEF